MTQIRNYIGEWQLAVIAFISYYPHPKFCQWNCFPRSVFPLPHRHDLYKHNILFCLICFMRHINLSGSFMNDYCMLFLMAFVHQSIKRFGYLLTYMSLSAPIPHTLLLLLTFSLSIADRDTPDTRLVNRGSVDAMCVIHWVKSAAAATAADKMLQTETGTVQHETDRRKVVVDNNSWNRKKSRQSIRE